MSWVKRQELFENLNPLLKKYKYDGPQPPSYIPPNKRRTIQRYMDRSSFSPGNHVLGEDDGPLTSKGAAEEQQEKGTDYKDALKERQQDFETVKTFQNEQRIHYGRLDEKEQENRKRQNSDTRPVETYDQLVEQREANMNNSNRTNFFVNENEPAFINSMSRTMDAFDLRMSTFGGKPAEKSTKQKNFDKFVAEKRGFIRTTNLYQNQDPMQIVRQEKIVPIPAPGPAFSVSYDNRYKNNTTFATDAGRVKNELNVNQHDQEALRRAQKTELMDELRYSNIKFDLDEKGAEFFKERDRKFDQARQSARARPVMQTIGEVRESQEQALTRLEDKRVLNAGMMQVAPPRLADFDSGGQFKANLNNEIDPDRYKSPRYSERRSVSKGPVDWVGSPFMNKNNSYVKDGQKQGPYPSQFGDGLRPYELWKKQMVTKSGSVTLGKNRDIKQAYDQSSKAHLTTIKGSPHEADYKPIAQVFHGKRLSVDPKHYDLDESVHKFMKTPNVKIGKLYETGPNEVNTTNQTHLTDEVHKGNDVPNLRRCDPNNPNRIKTVGFGFGSEKGTYEHQVVHRNTTFYGNVFHKSKMPYLQPDQSKKINERRQEFQMLNKFEYGYDQRGGSKANSPLDGDDPIKIKKCLDMSARGHQQREEFKEHTEKQNFTIQHDKELGNSLPANQIGEHQGKGLENIIDQDDLKASHVPIPQLQKDRLKMLGSFYGSTNLSPALTNSKDHILAQRKEYRSYKEGSEESKVPFSHTRRNRLERTYEKFDKVNGYGASVNTATFSWKVPKYDLS